MAGGFGDSLGKQAVRQLWNSPLLTHLNRHYGLRYRYMGLPGVDLLDVHLWRHMIDEVVAFEVRAKRKRDDPLGRRNIVALRRNLQLLGIPSRAYYGPMEEVIILRTDYDGTKYSQERLVTLCNLDFCDEISSKVSTRMLGDKVWRFQALRQILTDQQASYDPTRDSGIFVLLLTVRNQMDAAKLRGLLEDDLYEGARRYLETCGTLLPLPESGAVTGTHAWALKTLMYNSIRQYLVTPHISAVFFPLIKYTGRSKSSPMLHLMILCRFADPERHTPLFVPRDYLTDISSVRARDDRSLVWDPEPGEQRVSDGVPQPVAWFNAFEPTFLSGMARRTPSPDISLPSPAGRLR